MTPPQLILEVKLSSRRMSFLGTLLHSGTIARSFHSMSRVIAPSSVYACSLFGKGVPMMTVQPVTVQTRSFAKYGKTVGEWVFRFMT